jgi:outer membrane protein OmpA-like peptidoglycan-associated protein
MRDTLSAMFSIPQDQSAEWRNEKDSLLFIKEDPLWEIVCDFYFYALDFAKETRFDRERVSAFMSITKRILEADICSLNPKLGVSFQRFKGLLSKHSVEWSPHKTGIFTSNDVKAIMEYMLSSYFKHFKLYAFNFTKKKREMLVQVTVHNIQEAKAVRPLCQAVESVGNETQVTKASRTDSVDFDATFFVRQESCKVDSLTTKIPTPPSGKPSTVCLSRTAANASKTRAVTSDNMRWQYSWSCNSSSLRWGTYTEELTGVIEAAYQLKKDSVINMGGNTERLFEFSSLCLRNVRSNEKVQLRRLDPCPGMEIRTAGQLAKRRSQEAYSVAILATKAAIAHAMTAHKSAVEARIRRAVNSCELKCMLWYRRVKTRMWQQMLRDMQARIDSLLADNQWDVKCDLIKVDIIKGTVAIAEQVQFESGTADIKDESTALVQQILVLYSNFLLHDLFLCHTSYAIRMFVCPSSLKIQVCRRSISVTCQEFGQPNMHWRVEGHTAKSKKSLDGGRSTSLERARAVCGAMIRNGVDPNVLHPVGCGCFQPPKDPSADPRRVEIHVIRST